MVNIKQTTSKHSLSVDRPRWGRPNLDLSILNKLLETLIEDNRISVTTGKKRRADDPEAHTGPSKRQKLTDATKAVLVQRDGGEEADLKVFAFKHTYDFAFTQPPPDADNANAAATEADRKEVEVLEQTLRSLHQSSPMPDRDDILLSATVATESMGGHIRYTLVVSLPNFDRPLMSVDVDHPPERYGSIDYHQINPISAAHLLRGNYGVDLDFSVRLWPTLDPDHSPQRALPLKISIDMEVSLHFPQIALPPKNIHRRNYYDAWNALIKHLFPPPPARFPNYRGETDITFIYSILESAPPLPSTVLSACVQPEALLPTLLPFQQRSVLWMLHREGKTLNKKGRVVAYTPDCLPLFWEAFQMGGQTVYLNRLKEILSITPPPPYTEHPGGSLNEAPGLGKTVECLALILLNPDIRRNPTVKRWDSAAEVHVREVHVSRDVPPILTLSIISTH